MPRLNLSESETRALILDEAERLFLEIGYDKTTVADIARACGFSSSNVHRVFGTKAVINRAIAARALHGKFEAALAAADAHDDAAEKIRAFTWSIYQSTLTTFTDQRRVHHMVSCAIDERWEEVQNYRMALLNAQRGFIRYGVERGEFHVENVDDAGAVLHISTMRFCHPLCLAELDDAEDGASFEAWFNYTMRALQYRLPEEARASALP